VTVVYFDQQSEQTRGVLSLLGHKFSVEKVVFVREVLNFAFCLFVVNLYRIYNNSLVYKYDLC